MVSSGTPCTRMGMGMMEFMVTMLSGHRLTSRGSIPAKMEEKYRLPIRRLLVPDMSRI